MDWSSSLASNVFTPSLVHGFRPLLLCFVNPRLNLWLLLPKKGVYAAVKPEGLSSVQAEFREQLVPADRVLGPLDFSTGENTGLTGVARNEEPLFTELVLEV